MPTVSVERTFLIRCLAHGVKRHDEAIPPLSDADLDDLLFTVGLELDEIVKDGDDTTYKIEVGANRCDLLCAEGIARTLNIFTRKMPVPRFVIVPHQLGRRYWRRPVRIVVDVSTTRIRPHLVAAALYNVELDEAVYKSFIDLQDKLHFNIGRRRSLVSIGTHDLDTLVEADNGEDDGSEIVINYEGRPATDLRFVALGQSKAMSVVELYAMYHTTGSHLKPYLGIIGDRPNGGIRPETLHPVITTKVATKPGKVENEVILSLPPVINGARTALVAGRTTNILIEVTATDSAKAVTALDTMCAMFSQYCRKPYEIGQVNVVYNEADHTRSSPLLASRHQEIDWRDAIRITGLPSSVTAVDVASLLGQMSLPATTVTGKPDRLMVDIGPTRHDVLHAYDIYEDLAIAYGYNNIPRCQPPPPTTGSVAVGLDDDSEGDDQQLQLPINALSDKIRFECAMAGYTEVLTFSLCSRHDLAVKLAGGGLCENTSDAVAGEDVIDYLVSAVHVANPKTQDFQVVRTTLLPGLFKTVAANKDHALPVRIFEVSDVVVRSVDDDTGARNERRICALVANNKSAMFEAVHGLLDRLMARLQVRHFQTDDGDDVSVRGDGRQWTYQLQKIDSGEATKTAHLLTGRCASVVLSSNVDGVADTVIGNIGVVNPTVLKAFDLVNPCSVMEINVEPFL